mgnify:CR=1 FL=1
MRAGVLIIYLWFCSTAWRYISWWLSPFHDTRHKSVTTVSEWSMLEQQRLRINQVTYRFMPLKQACSHLFRYCERGQQLVLAYCTLLLLNECQNPSAPRSWPGGDDFTCQQSRALRTDSKQGQMVRVCRLTIGPHHMSQLKSSGVLKWKMCRAAA